MFVISGFIATVGVAGLIAGAIQYPQSNLLGGYALAFGPLYWLGTGALLVVLVVWLIHKAIRMMIVIKRDNGKSPGEAGDL